jgi:hypothetical protein
MPDTVGDESPEPTAAIEIRLSRPQQLFNSLDRTTISPIGSGSLSATDASSLVAGPPRARPLTSQPNRPLY